MRGGHYCLRKPSPEDPAASSLPNCPSPNHSSEEAPERPGPEFQDPDQQSWQTGRQI